MARNGSGSTYDDDQYADDYYDDGESAGDSFLNEQLARTPWWATSLSLHMFLILVILPMIDCKGPRKIPPIKFVLGIEPAPEEPLEEEKPLDPSTVKDPEQPVVKDAVESDEPPAEHNESADDMPTETAKGKDTQYDSSLDQRFNNEALGLGASAGGPYGRGPGGRYKKIVNGGGDRGTMKATLLGLLWLKRHQSPSGRWDGDGFQAQCKGNTCSGVAKLGWVDPGLTGLATLAYLGAGNTHQHGRFKETVKKALRYLIKVQASDGLIGGRRGHYMYNHAICALALAEAYGMTKSPLIKSAAQKAINWLVRAQNPGMGWRYHEKDGDNDISVTGWAVMALKSAKVAELQVPGIEQSFKSAETYVESITDDTYYITGYRTRPPRGYQGPTSSRFLAPGLGVNTANSHAANHTPTALATMCRVFFGRSKNDPRLRGGASAMAQMVPVWDAGGGGKLNQIDFYYWYYATLAMFQMGGDYWRQWNKHMKAALVNHQRQSGDEAGSWDPIGAWGFAGGRVYATAINTLSLEIYYRYARVFRG